MVVTEGAFLEHVCQAVICHGRHSRRPGQGWCRRSIGRRSWPLPLGYSAAQTRGFCPGVQALTVRRCCTMMTPADVLAVEVASIQTGVWKRWDGRRCYREAGGL